MQIKTKKFNKILKCWQLYLLGIPAIIHILIFSYGTMYGVIVAFKDFQPKLGYWGSEWVGLKHFIRFVNHPDLLKMIKNTLSITLRSLATFPCAIILALIINEVKNAKFKKFVQMVTYAPYFLSTVVLCGLIILFVGREGPLGMLYGFFTGKSQDLLMIPELFADIYVLSDVWQGTGWGTIIYLAALAGVPQELIEAAKIDGANRVQVIRHINIPCIMPTVTICLIMSTGGLLALGFEKIFLLQNSLNHDASMVISTYVYNIGLVGGQFSYSAAIGLFNTVVNLFILMIVNMVTKKISGTGIW